MCKICDKTNRIDIESSIIRMSEDHEQTIEQIAEQYKVDVDELKTHALFHTPLVRACDLDPNFEYTPQPSNPNSHDSLTRQMKLREADLLSEVANEYLLTMKTMGRRINRMAQIVSIDAEDSEKEVKLAKLLTKPMVELYIGAGGEVRQTVKTMAEINRLLNGEADPTLSGLSALADAIRGSGSDSQ